MWLKSPLEASWSGDLAPVMAQSVNFDHMAKFKAEDSQ